MVDIGNIIDKNLISLDLDLRTKSQVLETMADIIYKEGKLISSDDESVRQGFLESLWERERIFSTAVGFSFGIPHGKCSFVKEACIAYTRLKNEIEWSEEEKVKYIFMIGISDERAGNEHIEILIRLSTSILDDGFRKRLEQAENEEEALEIIREYTAKERSS